MGTYEASSASDEYTGHLAPPETKYRADCTQQDDEIQNRAPPLDVIQVVLELYAHFFQRRCVTNIHLRPAGNTRFLEKTSPIERDQFLEVPHQFRPFRPGANQGHFAP